jgi:hypothetical protein
VQRAPEADQVRLEVVSNGNLADRRPNAGHPNVMGGKDLACCLKLLIVKIKHIGVPCAAELDVVNAKVVQHLALDLQVCVNLVGESGKGPHGQAPVL